MIVLCVGMYRSCSTWQYGVASLILEQHRQGRRLGFIEGARFADLGVADQPEDGWRAVKAHDAHPVFDAALHDGRALGLFAYRDVRDVAQSWMHMTGATFAEITGRFLPLCLSNDRFWRTRPHVLVQAYEEIVAEPDRAVAQIAAHLGVALSGDDARAIAEAMSREANRKRIEKLNEKLRAEGAELRPENLALFDDASLLHWNHIRDGRSGLWRDEFDAVQCRELAGLCGAWLVDRGYEPDLSWAGRESADTPADRSPRISYAPLAEDIRLDRIFGGRAGTFLDLGSAEAGMGNRTFSAYGRGWRGVNVVPGAASLAEHRRERPDDLNLLVELDAEDGPAVPGEPTPPVRSLASLAAQYRITAPDLVVVGGAAAEPDRLEAALAGFPWDLWQPAAFMIADDPAADPDPAWQAVLAEHNYVAAGWDGANRFYLSAEHADRAVDVARPIVPALEPFERGELVRMRADRDRHRGEIDRLTREHAAALEAKDAERAEALAATVAEWEQLRAIAVDNLNRERTNSIQGLIGERDWIRALRDQAVAELGHVHGRLAIEQSARAAEQAANLAQQAANLAEQDRLRAEVAAGLKRIAALEAERDDLREDCATWEAEATRRARLAHAERERSRASRDLLPI